MNDLLEEGKKFSFLSFTNDCNEPRGLHNQREKQESILRHNKYGRKNMELAASFMH
jgi:hypothetical protein